MNINTWKRKGFVSFDQDQQAVTKQRVIFSLNNRILNNKAMGKTMPMPPKQRNVYKSIVPIVLRNSLCTTEQHIPWWADL